MLKCIYMGNGGCIKCGANDVVNVGGKDYCANCGAKFEAQAAPVAAPAPVAPPPSAPVNPVVSMPVAPPAPVQKPGLSDLRPATGLGQVIDLRQQSQPGPVAPTPPPLPTPPPAPEPIPEPVVPPIVEPSMPSIEMILPSDKTEQRAQTAQSIEQSPQVNKFQPSEMPAAAPLPADPVQTPGELPNAVLSTHQGMQKLISQAEIAHTAMPSPSVKSRPKLQMAGATAVIGVLGLYVWFANYPKMAVRIAGSRAGLTASFPAFVPSSYALSGAVAYGSGEISYQLKSPAAENPLTIYQKATDWDSKSLYENYVKGKGNSQSIAGQGLTIYLSGNEASWVNRGIWYKLEGTERLNQEQILKIAYSL